MRKILSAVFIFILIVFMAGCFSSKNKKEEEVYSSKLQEIIQDSKMYNYAEKRAEGDNFIGEGIYINVLPTDKITPYEGWYYYSVDSLAKLKVEQIHDLLYLLAICGPKNRVYVVFGDMYKSLFEYNGIEDTKNNGESMIIDLEEEITKVDEQGETKLTVIDIATGTKPYVKDYPYTVNGGIVIIHEGNVTGNEIVEFKIESDLNSLVTNSSIEVLENGRAKINVNLTEENLINDNYKISSKNIYFGIYNYVLPRAALPVMNPVGGIYENAQTVTITSATTGAAIRYTLDGTTPTALSILYESPINIAENTTLKAIALKEGIKNSDVVTAVYVITIEQEKVNNPEITPAGGTYNSIQTVTLTSTTTGAEIRYTLDDTTPNVSSALYSEAISITENTTLKAIAIKSGMINSDVVTAVYVITIEQDKVNNPEITPAGGTYDTAQAVTITSATSGASIRYTIDGTTPTALSTLYSEAISITENTTLKAIGIKEGMIESDVVTEVYNINLGIGSMHPLTGAFSKVDYVNWGTEDYPLGSHFESTDVTFAVYSKNATKVLLEIYDTAYGNYAKYDYWMEKGADNIWRAKLKDVPEGTYYAFRTWGPNWPYTTEWKRGNSTAGFISDVDDNGNRFNPNKAIFDPYTRELSHDKEFPEMIAAGETGGMYGTGGADTPISGTEKPHVYKGTITTNGLEIDRRNIDTGAWVPKGIVLKPTGITFSKPDFSEESSIIYEAHVRGITAHSSSSNLQTILSGVEGFDDIVNVPAQYRGTYKGAAYLAKYLKALGINVIELLPVHETENDLMPLDGSEPTLDGTKNFWGYMTFGFFAPDRRYAYDKSPGGPTREFQEMVKAFNDEGIKVYLDVVYNHTGEGGNWGNMDVTGFVSMGGFDAAEYYHLVPGGDDKNWLVDGATGCGNQVNFSRGRTVTHNLVLDSLTYWTETMGISGYRFDLAAVLGRDIDKHSWEPSNTYWDGRVKEFETEHPLLVAIADLGDSLGAHMVAEAWDMWAYPVGQFPNRWAEWNGRYRDAIRRYMTGNVSGHDGVSYTDAFHGDYTHFNDQGGPHKSINFLVAHDGFTLADLVSYNLKNNYATPQYDNGRQTDLGMQTSWPFGPSDGGNSNNDSWDSAGDKELRRQRLRNFWTFQMFSRGTPMIVYGDEVTRTQNGNNNPYNIDSVMTWNNYNMINSDAPQSVATEYGGIYHNNVGTDTNPDDMNNLFLFAANVMKIRRNNTSLHQDDYTQSFEYTKADGTVGFNAYSDKAVRIRRGEFLIMSNMAEIEVTFTVPEAAMGKKWVRIIDTAAWAETEANNYWKLENAATITGTYGVNAYSMVVLQEVADTIIEKVSNVTFSLAEGTYYETKSLTLSCGTEGATIKYTTDDSDPKTSVTAVTGTTISITTTTTVKAIAFKSGMTDSDVVTKRYIIELGGNDTLETILASDGTYTDKVEITWQPVNGATLYNVYRADTVEGTYTKIGDTATTAYSDTTASQGRRYYKASYIKDSTESTLSKMDGGNIKWEEPRSWTSRTNYVDSTNEVILQGFYWYIPDEGTAGEIAESNLYQVYKNNASKFSQDGFTYIWMPPSGKAFSLTEEYNVGYAVYDPYDLGEFYQMGRVRTKYGTKKELIEAVDTLHANGIKVIADIVMNHRLGAETATTMGVAQSQPAGSTTVQAYLTFDFNRSTDKDPRGTVHSDFVWNPEHFDGMEDNGSYYLFTGKTLDSLSTFTGETHLRTDIILGADIDHQHEAVKAELIEWSKWLTDTLKLSGYRVDAIKHIDTFFVREWANAMKVYNSNALIFAELWDGWAARLNAYAYNTPKTGATVFDNANPDSYSGIANTGGVSSMQLFDVPLHYTFQKIAGDNEDTGDMNMLTDANLSEHALLGLNPTNAITFVDNHDTVPTEMLASYIAQKFKLQAYTYILLHKSGIPTVYYRDMYKGVWPNEYLYTNKELGKYTHGDSIEVELRELIDIRHRYAYGEGRSSTTAQTSEGDLLAYAREGKNGEGIVFVIAKPGKTGSAGVTTFQTNTEFEQIIGDSIGSKVTTGGDGTGTFSVGAKGYSVWKVVTADMTASEAAAEITTLSNPSSSDTLLTLPSVPAGFTIAIKSSSNTDVIALDRTITKALTETEVTLVFTVTKIADSTTADTTSITVTVPAQGSVSNIINFYFKTPPFSTGTPELQTNGNGTTWGFSEMSVDLNGWYKKEVTVTDANAEITYQVRFPENATYKYQKATGNFAANPTYTTATGSVWVDGSDPEVYSWSGDEFYLTAYKITSTQP